MNNEFSVVRLILDASIPVQIVLALLLIASIASWAVIFEKRRLVKQAMKSAGEFESSFWSGGDLNNLYRDLARTQRLTAWPGSSRRASASSAGSSRSRG